MARCSYAVYLAHNNLAWSHGKDLIVEMTSARESPEVEDKEEAKVLSEPACNNVRTL